MSETGNGARGTSPQINWPRQIIHSSEAKLQNVVPLAVPASSLEMDVHLLLHSPGLSGCLLGKLWLILSLRTLENPSRSQHWSDGSDVISLIRSPEQFSGWEQNLRCSMPYSLLLPWEVMSLFTTFLRNQSNFREKSFCFPDLILTKIERRAGSLRVQWSQRRPRLSHRSLEVRWLAFMDSDRENRWWKRAWFVFVFAWRLCIIMRGKRAFA